MLKRSLFIALEGLDGSGKTTLGRLLADFLNAYLGDRVRFTFEPNDHSCGGEYIRSVLKKQIANFSSQTLALAFAANRMDHNDRLIGPWLEKTGQLIVCDRYYLSSLVYQSGNQLSLDDVMHLNRFARKPDLTLFMNVSNETSYARMGLRNKPRELFEENLSETRAKFLEAIRFLRQTRAEHIVEIDANGSKAQVFTQLLQALIRFAPDLQELLPGDLDPAIRQFFDSKGPLNLTSSE